MEELSVLLSLKDITFGLVGPNSPEHGVLVRLMADVFVRCDVRGLLDYENALRSELLEESPKSLEALERARESRAASVMQMAATDAEELDARPLSTFGGPQSLEEAILHCCHLQRLSPTTEFQLGVSQVSHS